MAVLGLHCYAGFSPLAAGGAPLQLECVDFSLRWLLLCGAQALGCIWASAVAAPRLWSTGSVVVVHRLSCSTACGIFLDQGSNPCLLHWQADSLPLSHQTSPPTGFFSTARKSPSISFFQNCDKIHIQEIYCLPLFFLIYHF